MVGRHQRAKREAKDIKAQTHSPRDQQSPIPRKPSRRQEAKDIKDKIKIKKDR
jgi:hypothetical protein